MDVAGMYLKIMQGLHISYVGAICPEQLVLWPAFFPYIHGKFHTLALGTAESGHSLLFLKSQGTYCLALGSEIIDILP